MLLAQLEILKKTFFKRNPEVVARNLIGNLLVRRLHDNVLKGSIVETEAYLGEDDPASRARHGMKNYNREMWGQPGTVFIYNVHKYWMLNIVSHKQGYIGAVLIRAIEPLEGIWFMQKNRKVQKKENLTNGPGKLTVAWNIDKQLNGIPVTTNTSEIVVQRVKDNAPQIRSSFRVGVKQDLEIKLRFYIKNNRFVSRI